MEEASIMQGFFNLYIVDFPFHLFFYFLSLKVVAPQFENIKM